MDTASLASLVASLSMTRHVLSGYPLPDKAVEVQAIPQTELNAMVCDRFCNAQGAFLAGRGVFLASHLDLSADVRHRAVLLHELVHEAQERTGAFADLPPCERYHRREAEAYGVEHAYLRRFGLSGVTLAGPQRWQTSPCEVDGSAFAPSLPPSTMDGPVPQGRR
jgi:hypothetical protein